MTLVQTEPKKIIYGEPIIVSDMQGPCPDGFHVPLNTEWQAVYDILITTFGLAQNATTMGTYLKMPMAGYRRYGDAIASYVKSYGYYWSSTPYGTNYCYNLNFNSSNINPQDHGYARANGFSVRCFKNSPTIPTSSWTTLYQGSGSAGIFWNSTDGLISVSGDGTTWYTIQDKNLGATAVFNQGDTLTDANCGYFYQRGNNYGFAHSGTVATSSTKVNASNYGPGNYYNSSTFIMGSENWSSVQNDNLWGGVTQGTSEKSKEIKAVYLGDTKVRPSAMPAGIYHNATLGLISLSSDGENWLTIADKNLGATSTDVTSSNSYGYFYQWGNCYGFPTTGSVTKSSSYVNISGYGPSNYYRNSTWRTMSQSYSNYTNLNLWGGTTGTNEAMKGPCDTGFHIPKDSELQNLLTTWINITGHTTSDIAHFSSELLIPRAGERRYSDASRINAGSYMWLWASTAQNSNYGKVLVKDGAYIRVTYMDYTYGCNIRPFKNEAVQPDTSRTKLN